MRRNLPFKALVAFEAAARHLHFGRAGSELNVGGSAISHQVARLEALLGATLFLRAHGRVSLTKAGSVLADGLTDSFARVAELMAAASGGARAVPAGFELAAGASFSALWLARRIDRYRTVEPTARIRLSSVATWPTARDSFDIAIIYSGAAAPRYEWAPFAKEKIAPYAGGALARRIGRTPDLAAVAARPLIASNNVVGWRDWFRSFGAGAEYRGSAFDLDRSMLAIDLARRGKGLILESDLMVRDSVRARKLVRLSPHGTKPIAIHGYRIAAGGAGGHPAAMAAFVEWLWRCLPVENREPWEPIAALLGPSRRPVRASRTRPKPGAAL